MTDRRTVVRTRSKTVANAVVRLLQRHGIAVETGPRFVGGILSGSRFNDISVLVGSENEAQARELLLNRNDEIQAHLSRVDEDYGELERKLSYVFRDRTILEQALTHRSRAQEEDGFLVEDNETLEFLGDAVLGVVIADYLYREYPDYDEGQKSKLKAHLVSSAKLAEIGTNLALGDYLLLGRSELKSGGRRKPSLLENAVEAIIAAVYLDGGHQASVDCVQHLFAGDLGRVRKGGTAFIGNKDFKSALQELLQAKGRPLPEYQLANTTGPEHDKAFTIELHLDGDVFSIGKGRSKKEAEQCAAEKALTVLRNGG